MSFKLVYATGDDFKWKERKELAKTFGVELERADKVELGRKIEMLETIEDAAILKWKTLAKKTEDLVMADMNDILLTSRLSWYNAKRQDGIDIKEYVANLWFPIDGKTADLMKVGLKNVLVVGKNGQTPMVFQSILDGIIMYRPPQKIFEKLPLIVPLVYVTGWQEMLDKVYMTKMEERSSSRITHDGKNLIQALARLGV